MLTSGVPDVFHSHHEVMDALDQNFAGSDDPQRAMAVNKLREDMTTACQRQEDDAKAAVLGTFAKPVHTTCKVQHLLVYRVVSASMGDTRGSNSQGGS